MVVDLDYALDAVCYDLLRGKVDEELIDLKHIESAVVPAEVREILSKMLAPRRADRYPSSAELAADLEVLRKLL